MALLRGDNLGRLWGLRSATYIITVVSSHISEQRAPYLYSVPYLDPKGHTCTTCQLNTERLPVEVIWHSAISRSNVHGIQNYYQGFDFSPLGCLIHVWLSGAIAIKNKSQKVCQGPSLES